MTEPNPSPNEKRWGLSLELIVMNAGFVVLVCAIVWGVLSRYVTEQPATWVEEVSSIAFTWVVFIGAAEVHRRGKHVSVDLLTGLFPPKIRSVVEILGGIFVALFCFYLAWLGTRQAIVSNSASTPMLKIPLSVPYVGLALGFVLMGFRSLQRLALRLRRS